MTGAFQMFENLPDELLTLCFSFTGFHERKGIFLCCRRLNQNCFKDIPSSCQLVIFCNEFKNIKRKAVLQDLMKGNVGNFKFSDGNGRDRKKLKLVHRITEIPISQKTHCKFVELFLSNYGINSEKIESIFKSCCFYSLKKSFDILMNAGVSSAKWFEEFINDYYSFKKIILQKNQHIIRGIFNSGKLDEELFVYGILEVILSQKEEDKEFKEFLLSLKPDKKSVYCRSMLIEAVKSDLPEIVMFLLKHGADINYKFEEYRGYSCTALEFAIIENKFDMVKLLLNNGADINLCSDNYLFKIENIGNYLLDRGLDVTKLSMYSACLGGHISLIERMISLGAKVSTKSQSGFGCLDGIMMAGTYGKLHEVQLIIKVCKLLFANGAKIEENTSEMLWRVCQTASLELIQLFFSHGADFNIKFYLCDPPIFGAIKSGNLEVVKFLVETLHVDLNVKDKWYNSSPLRYAGFISGDRTAIVNYLSSL